MNKETNFATYKFKHEFPLIKFVEILNKYEQTYEVDNNKNVQVLATPETIIGKVYTLDQIYNYCVSTYTPKRFAGIRKIFQRVKNMFPDNLNWKYVLLCCGILFALAFAKVGIEQFKGLSFVDKIKFTANPIAFSRTKIEDYIADNTPLELDTEEPWSILTTFSRFNPENESEDFLSKLLNRNTEEVVETPPKKETKMPNFGLVFGVMLSLLAVIAGALIYVYKDTLSGLSNLKNIRFKR